MSVVGELKFTLRVKIDHLKSGSVKNKLLGLYKAKKFGEIKPFVGRILQHPATPYSPIFRLVRDFKTRRDMKKNIKKIEEELEKIKEASEKLEKEIIKEQMKKRG
jgi:hypothetical protein